LNLHEISQSLRSFEMTADVMCEGFRSGSNHCRGSTLQTTNHRWSRKKSKIRRQCKKLQMQGAQIRRNEVYVRVRRND